MKIKLLALSGLAGGTSVPPSVPSTGTNGTPKVHQERPSAPPQPSSPCGSLDCACYEIGGGGRIHPPKCGRSYLVTPPTFERMGIDREIYSSKNKAVGGEQDRLDQEVTQ
jgi:hypothetical protein